MKRYLVAIAKIFIPAAIGIAVLLTVGFLLDPSIRYKYWYLCMAYFFPPLGKESVIPIGVYGGDFTVPIIGKHVHISPINPAIMALSIAFIDSVVSLFMVWNYDLVKKIPLLGNFIQKVEELAMKGNRKYAWVMPLKFVGIVLFVMIPFQGSGGVVGSILGRIMGMSAPMTWLAVTTGALIGCFIMAYFAKLIFSNILAGISLLFILTAIAVIIKIWRESK